MNSQSETQVSTDLAALREKVHEYLCSRVVDQIFAWGMVAFGTYLLALSIHEKRGFELLMVLSQVVIHNLFLVVRKKPERITLNPLFWIIAFAGAHWHFLYGIFRAVSGIPVAPIWLTHFLSVAGGLLFIWARVSLGRNFGMVPAQRDIVTGGAYRWVRHPIYTSSFLLGLSYHLSNCSIPILLIWSMGLLVMVTKALMEEHFLAGVPEYQNYRSKVRYRFIPGLA